MPQREDAHEAACGFDRVPIDIVRGRWQLTFVPALDAVTQRALHVLTLELVVARRPQHDPVAARPNARRAHASQRATASPTAEAGTRRTSQSGSASRNASP